jgi:hypothetical protein
MKRSFPAVGAIIIIIITGMSLSVRASVGHGSAAPGKLSAADVSTAAVKAAVTRALVIHQRAYASSQQMLTSPPMFRQVSTAVRLPTEAGALASTAFSVAYQRQLTAAKIAQVSLMFSGAAAFREDRIIDTVQEADKNPNFHSLDGGVSKIVINSIEVSSGHATVHARATMWTSMAQRNPDNDKWVTAIPENVLEITMGLNLDPSGRWIVSTFTWSFAPGSEP